MPSSDKLTEFPVPIMDRLVAEAVSYASLEGIIMSTDGGATLSHAPFTLFPSLIDSTAFNTGLTLCPLLNSMIARIAADHQYLRSVLAETAVADSSFTGRLLSMLDIARKPNSGVELSIFRHDFFVHQSFPSAQPKLRMVEMNCIAAGFGSLATRATAMHKVLATHPSVTDAHSPAFKPGDLPPNDALGDITNSMAVAHNAFVDKYCGQAENPQYSVRLIAVVQPRERNAYDQDHLRWVLFRHHGLHMVRMTLAEIHASASISEDGALCIAEWNGLPSFKASVVYFRAGYDPADYPSEKEWDARRILEQSTAALCPSVAVQLVGTKKIQQVLDTAGEVEKFVDRKADADLIRSCFARQYSLSTEEDGDEAVQLGIKHPEDYVLKPQREGGGNNLYTAELKHALETMSAAERSAYILMERIRPVAVENILVRSGQWQKASIVSELGVYGTMVRVDGIDHQNCRAGHLLRSKLADKEDGGISAGIAALDSPRFT